MRKQALILGALLLLPLAANAADQNCEHSQPRNLQLDMAGVKTVVFEVGANDLDVRAVPAPGNTVAGRACDSREGDLSRLVDRKSVVEGKSVYVRVDLGVRRILKKKNNKQYIQLSIMFR